MGPTLEEAATALARLGNYRVLRAQQVANAGDPDGISGALLLAFGMRETWLRNIEGGAKLVDGRWVPETDPSRMDVGWTQISRRYHRDALDLMPGVKTGTWGPVVPMKTAAEAGFVPRFEEALQFTLRELHESIAFAEDHGVAEADRIPFAGAAHNAGQGGALQGYRAGDVDKFTAGGDYSAWVLAARKVINRWLGTHPNWLVR